MKHALLVLAVSGFLLLAGCVDDPGTNPAARSDEPQYDALPARPWQAGELNGTTLTMHEAVIENATVRYVHFTSITHQKCESDFFTEGNITEPWAIGLAVALSPDRVYFNHPFIREGIVNAELAESDVPRIGGEFPQYVHGRSTSSITLDEGEEMTYYVAASYPSNAENHGGKMDFEVSCPDGMEALETGWSSIAHLLSDVSMNGTSASVYAEVQGQPVRWGAQPKSEWTAGLPEGPTMFVANEPLAGRAILSSPSGDFACGPSADPEPAARGRALCMHEFDGGDTTIEVSQSPPGQYLQSGTSGAWMAMVAQLEYYAWPDAP